MRSDNSSARVLKKYWWRFQAHRPILYQAISALPRCLLNSQVSRHVIFTFQPVDRIFSHAANVFLIPGYSAFTCLQARIHAIWTILLSSSLGGTLRYIAGECFETFPFPQPDPRTEIPTLEDIGHRLYEARAAYMVETQQGLTKTYNHLKDPTCTDPPIVELRRLHEEMDRAVLEAYGWDVDVPPYASPVTVGERRRLEAFEDEVIDRLFVLNAERAAEERALGLVADKKKKLKKPEKKRDVHAGQTDLFAPSADVPAGRGAGRMPALPAALPAA
ncbi:MAG: hypothetical protein GY835_28385, partial [bacterium]|nr:hypothetical protein [bacterium]